MKHRQTIVWKLQRERDIIPIQVPVSCRLGPYGAHPTGRHIPGRVRAGGLSQGRPGTRSTVAGGAGRSSDTLHSHGHITGDDRGTVKHCWGGKGRRATMGQEGEAWAAVRGARWQGRERGDASSSSGGSLRKP